MKNGIEIAVVCGVFAFGLMCGTLHDMARDRAVINRTLELIDRADELVTEAQEQCNGTTSSGFRV